MTKSWALTPILICILSIGSVAPVAAQSLYGSVVGQIVDPSGASVSQATVTLTGKEKGQEYEAKADESGRFVLPNVLPGDFDLKVAAPGFRILSHTDIRVSAGSVTRSDFNMELGSITEQVTVEGSATVLQTDKADTHTELSAKHVSNMPLPGFRNY